MKKQKSNYETLGVQFFSLNKKSPLVDFKEATLRGQAPDGGLYFPEKIPQIEPDFFSEIENIPDEEIAFRVIEPYVGKKIPAIELRKIVRETIAFPIPLVKIEENIFSLELFHGPTLAFKDVGARFMSRCLSGLAARSGLASITVLVATSGDTGSAVANGFFKVNGVQVVILYPAGKVSMIQEKQLTTSGENIHAIKIDGSFDDCQKLVKQAFADEELTNKMFLTSANSINIARWLPQQFYYFLAWKQWPDKSNPPVVCVPSGNFGNIAAAILAHASGLPVKHFIAGCNANDVVPQYLSSGNYSSKKSVSTISNAMDVGDPNNFPRVMEIFHQQFSEIKNKLTAYSISDAETRRVIEEIYRHRNYLLDPHGAVGYLSLKKYLNGYPDEKGYFVGTAHPAKFLDVVEPVINEKIEIPERLEKIINSPGHVTEMDNNYSSLRNFLLAVR
jgi:threonine synthase